MRMVDVTPHNKHLDDFLFRLGGTGYGIRTQIRLDYLKADGFHILPQYGSVLDKTYACAVMKIDVPCPTPRNEFMPEHIRRRWRNEWPVVGRMGDNRSADRSEGPNQIHGWRY